MFLVVAFLLKFIIQMHFLQSVAFKIRFQMWCAKVFFRVSKMFKSLNWDSSFSGTCLLDQ